jgi:hypothetical protein
VIVAENHLIAMLPCETGCGCSPSPNRCSWNSASCCEPGEPTRHVYFPNDCFISLVKAIEGEPGAEVGMVGREGMLGARLVLGVGTIALHALVQGAGTVRRIAAAPFRRELAHGRAVLQALNRYLYVADGKLATSTACTRFHSVGPRLARWC